MKSLFVEAIGYRYAQESQIASRNIEEEQLKARSSKIFVIHNRTRIT